MSSAPERKPGKGAFVLAFTSIYLIWGSTYLGIRVAVQSLPPFLMGAGRFLLAGLVLLVVVQRGGARWPSARQWRDNLLIGTFLLLGGNGFVALAERTLSSSLTALIIAVQPMFIVLTGWAWPGGRRPPRLTFVGLALGFAGVFWLVSPWEAGSAAGVDLRGVAFVLLACVSWSVGTIWARHRPDPAPAFQASAIQMLGGSAALFLGAWLAGDLREFSFARVSAASFWAFLYLAFVGSLIGYSTFVWLMKHTTPDRVATYAYVNPVVAVFLGWLVLDEPVTSRVLLAAVVIVVSVVIITRARSTVSVPKEGDGTSRTT